MCNHVDLTFNYPLIAFITIVKSQINREGKRNNIFLAMKRGFYK